MAYTIIGNNIHLGGRNGRIVFTSTNRLEVKSEYLRLAYPNESAWTPVEPGIINPLAPLPAATDEVPRLLAQVAELQAEVAELKALNGDLGDALDATQDTELDVAAVIEGYTARKNSAAWKAGLAQLEGFAQ